MNYEQKYKEALEWMRSIYPTMQGADKEDAEHHFPELKESEDEKIRKEILSYIKSSGAVTNPNWIAWLEKQGEKSWNEEDEKFLVDTMNFLYRAKNQYAQTARLEECIDWLKSLKPNHWKPSEQNIKDLEWCADLVKNKMGVGFHRLQVFIDEIKNL